MKLLVATFNDLDSYNVCRDFLSRLSGSTLEEIILSYNGRPSVLYVRLFYQNLRWCNAALSRASIHKLARKAD